MSLPVVGRWIAERRARRRHGLPNEVTVTPDNLDEIGKLIYWASERRFLRISLPVEIVTMNGAMAFMPGCNPLMLAQQDAEAYAAFLARFQPKTLADRFRVTEKDLLGSDLPAWWTPWVHPTAREKPRGEEGLGPEHGTSAHGPVTAEKMRLEMKRHDTVRRSIDSSGYLPQIYGDITGHFLRGTPEQGWRFVVRGGKHRAAALAVRGEASIPVRMKRNWPRCIDRRLVDDWPAVAAGDMEPRMALAVFDAHFDHMPLDRYPAAQ